MDLDQEERGGGGGMSRPAPGDPGGPRDQSLGVANERQPAGKERLREFPGGRIAERLPEPLRRAPVFEEAEPRLRFQYSQDRVFQPVLVEPARAHRPHEGAVRHHGISRNQNHVHSRPERKRRHLTVEAACPRALHLQGVTHHESGEPHLRPQHSVEDLG